MKSEIYWNAIGTTGLEHLHLEESRDGVHADGLVLRYHNGRGLRLGYEVQCDENWRTRELSAWIISEDEIRMQISSDGQGSWFDSVEKEIDFLQGCIDVDVMATPFTNTLPINRLHLTPGETRDIEVVYVRIPDLHYQRSGQRYTCLERGNSQSRYLYESLGSNFKAELVVDEDGLVISYQGIWDRAGIYRTDRI
jgi:hypothetical protein